MRSSLILAWLVLAFAPVLPARTRSPVALPAPQTTGDRPLLQVLRDRASRREFAPAPLPPQVL